MGMGRKLLLPQYYFRGRISYKFPSLLIVVRMGLYFALYSGDAEMGKIVWLGTRYSVRLLGQSGHQCRGADLLYYGFRLCALRHPGAGHFPRAAGRSANGIDELDAAVAAIGARGLWRYSMV